MKYNDFKLKGTENILNLREHEIGDGKTIPLLHYNRLDKIDWIEHCFTTREGGVSEGIFESLNLSFTRGDDEKKVMENYKRLAKALNCHVEDFVCTDQTHTTNVVEVTSKDRGNGLIKERPYSDVDGLITNESGIVLSTFYADCVPLYFVDTKNRVIGMSHSGWRGTANRMGKATLEAMKEKYGTDPEDVLAVVGPSICQDCYEISEDVADEFKEAFQGHEDEILINKGNGKYQLDLWKSNELVFKEAGVRPENIVVTNICTCCNSKLLFSHRASKGKRGNLGGFIMIK